MENEKTLGAQSATEGVTAGSIAPNAASHAAPVVISQVRLAIALLEIEAVMMQCRASMLAKDHAQLWDRLLDIKRRVNDVLIELVGGNASSEYSLAVPSEPAKATEVR